MILERGCRPHPTSFARQSWTLKLYARNTSTSNYHVFFVYVPSITIAQNSQPILCLGPQRVRR